MHRTLLSTLLFVGLLVGAISLSTAPVAVAQDISVYQYRRVPAENVSTFIERETTYWRQVAQKAIDDGKLTFWGLFQRVGGYDLENSSNFLFINTYTNIDSTSGVWNAAAVFPDVPMEEISTGGLGTTTSSFFVRAENWVQAEHATAADFRFIEMIYHNTTNPGQLITLENEHWAPFIKAAMDAKQVTQLAWGNATILSPTSPDIPATTISYDIYSSLKEALDPTWDENLEVPEGLAQIQELEQTRRGTAVYRIVSALSAPPAE